MKLNTQTLAKAVRTVTIAPIIALVLLIALYAASPANIGNVLNFILAVIFLVICPVIAYPLQPFVPGFKDKGREGQRSLAIWTANIGYCLGITTAVFMPVPRVLLVIYLTYFLSGILIMLFNRFFKIRASGHAAGAAGPIFASILFIGAKALTGLIVLGAVYWSSLIMKRHKLSELAIGTLIPLVALTISYFSVLLIS